MRREVLLVAGALSAASNQACTFEDGQGFATILLEAMEDEMQYRDMATAYTIARAPSFGMNITFARMGYGFAGRLINNTNIGGQFEDMNVWYKHLATSSR